MKAKLIFNTSRIVELKNGKFCKLYMDLYQVSDEAKKGSLANYKLSWIFFDTEEPSIRILMDYHEPIGLHVHINQGPQVQVDASSISEAMDHFFEFIKNHFGEEVEANI